MKKSEMAKMMTQYWLGLFPEEPYFDKELQKEVSGKMTELLNFLEHKGVLAPCRAGFGGHGTLNENNQCDDYVESCNHTWEPENEAQ